MTPVLRIQDDRVVLRPEGLPLSAEISQIAAAAGQSAGAAAIDAAADLGDSYNLFDKDAVRVDAEVQYNGGLYVAGDSVTSAAIDVSRLPAGSKLTISGLAANPALARVWAFYSDEPLATNAPEPNLISYVTIPGNGPFTATLPNGAKSTRVSVRQRQPGAGSFAGVQIERGDKATAFQPYAPRIIGFNGRPIGAAASEPSPGPDTSVGVVAIFGDSITATENVEAGQYVYGSGWSKNWPDFALPMLSPTSAYNFARGGAAFGNYSSAVPWQRFHHQLDVAFAQGFTPDCVIVALGVNDLRMQQDRLGSYDTAMGKAYNALDLTVSIEAARAGFYRLQQQWPDAVKFVSLPLQQAQLDGPTLQTWNALIARMAARYGFTVIDAFSEAGIVSDFEVSGARGRDLVDGLHTGERFNDANPSGRRKQGRLIAARVRARLGL
ncbi:SGNH/GDSL hydrolase family protein [Sphingomonas sp. Leaf10]|uniref:SGNH/GDSL hydrolase family protein n=1 Tax=Sphingomonas sp. Leaf10 TaxID=1735676 RepID=UPI0006F95881|nr:SGNH/GDSL hydrolase family protein [Sphingomonas sp. Leaf10]KQM37610.1 hypothetical protein ASE59_14080 [Sphingomonas sp. Leaf10]